MAAYTYTVDAPADVVALDQAVYSAGGGYPGSSLIGVRNARTDRFLGANLRRAFSYAWPLGDPPVLVDYHGADVGEWDVEIAQTCRRCRFYLRAEIANGDEAVIVPYCEQEAGGTHYRVPSNAADTAAQTIVGTGSPETYGPFVIDCVPGPARVGVVVHSLIAGSAGTKINVYAGVYSRGVFRGSDGDFTSIATTPPGAVLVYTDGTNQVGGPLQILAVSSSNPGTVDDDQVALWPDQRIPPSATEAYYYATTKVNLYSLAWEEVVETDVGPSIVPPAIVQTRGPAYIPIPNESATTGQQFRTASHWFLAAQNSQHFAGSRGRILVQDRYMDEEIGDAGLVEVARFVVQDDQLSDELLVLLRVSVQSPAWWANDFVTQDPAWVNLTCVLASEDTAGANVTDESGILDVDKQVSVPVLFDFGGRDSCRGNALRVDWPRDPYTQHPEQTVGFFAHMPDLALTPDGRVLIVKATVSAPLGGVVQRTTLRGVTVISSRRLQR